VRKQSGFEYAAERPDAETFVKQKWGWRSSKPGGQGVQGAGALRMQAHPAPSCRCRPAVGRGAGMPRARHQVRTD